ncbi:NAD/FAD-binding protein [Rhizobium rhizosphaerae]|uniref:NAD/FAD-binding protein n=1 Tax=Xaviernesmea rhizosphaerae TaxID=1672749 RepID=A0ABX3PJ48_9HYPH|nr:FAD-dependent oxidoreductase [Xaviernesmea rhizosphaerae]OQP88131.1 NAD/FAD-binding protein [Xaviernesmea rhizosphaerae]
MTKIVSLNAHRPAHGAGHQPRLKVAVIGSGISGSSAAWALNDVHDVTLFEKDARPGGHTATVDVDYNGRMIAVDTGFIVYNEANYPNLTALFDLLKVKTHPTSMSFSLSLDEGALEWKGGPFSSLFAQKRNLVRPSFLLMLKEILRFNRVCLADRSAGRLEAMSIGEYLDWRGFSPGFTNNYLIPMAAAIWSAPPNRMMEFPAWHFVRFFDNHRLIYSRPHPWRTVVGGSRTYLNRLLTPLAGRIRLSAGLRAIQRDATGVTLIDAAGHAERFDKVVIATHSDQARALLADATPAEEEILSAVPYQANRVVLHRDRALMPRREKVWASWNYLRSSSAEGAHRVAVSYWMNNLQPIDAACPLFVTLNPEREPDPKLVFGEYSYDHPQFSGRSMQAQERLATIQGDNHTYFAGAWTGYGFHEDGLSSGLAAAEALGATVPWRSRAGFVQAAE